MKKILLNLIMLSSVCGVANATNGAVIPHNNWNGLYVGANAGYWWGQNDHIRTRTSISFVNPTFPLGAYNIASALLVVGGNNKNPDGNSFIGGVHAGYNITQCNLLFGADLNIEGLADSNTTARTTKIVPLISFPESYTATISITQKIDYLVKARMRIGYLFTPDILFYGVGGLAFGKAEFNQVIVANESLGAFAYPPINAQSRYDQTRLGFTVGAGAEWMFMPQWSASLEYSYTDLLKQSQHVSVAQVNNLQIPAVTWAAIDVGSHTRFALGTIRVGIDYHFG